ncbi:MAG: ATP-binding protein [Spirochaetales bacterium]|nr:ATP-binding protein [Spirochaetales bacterium]
MKFYQSLRFKITLLFISLMVLGNTAAIYLANRQVTENYSQYASQADKQRAAMAALFLADSWDKIENNKDRLTTLPFQGRDEAARPGAGRFERSEPVPFVVIDRQGELIFNTSPGEPPSEKITHYRKGVPVLVDGEIKAYVLAGSMIDQKLSKFDSSMLQSINHSLILTNLVSTLSILVLGVILLGKMLAPLKKIDRAAADLGRGRYSVRTDVTGNDEIGRLGLHFDEMAQSLEESEQWKRRIIADTAHELRTPVALVLSRLEMIKDGIYPADDAQLTHLYGEVEKFSRLIGEMQRLASMEGGTVSLDKSKGPLNTFCLNQLNAFLPESRKRGINLLWKNQIVAEDFALPGTGQEREISADWNKLEQVMKNLLSNALRHTPEEGKLEVRTEFSEKEVVITVGDSGPGIPETDRTKIFDRFYRLDSARNRDHGGSGLGLAISKAIVEGHGGTISAGESSLGGAEFKVTLPL